MNHLAHCYLSFGQPDVLVGNFIGDFVKGKRWQEYPLGVQRGILLHRTIDAFTDTHPLTHQSTARIRPYASRYAGPIVDILYDYLLAIHWTRFATEPFDGFVQNTYKILMDRRLDMPEPLQSRVPRMIQGDFLTGYTRPEGLEFVLERFTSRLPGGLDWRTLWAFFLENQDDFSSDFLGFFPALVEKALNFE